jgi:hypothetical protein
MKIMTISIIEESGYKNVFIRFSNTTMKNRAFPKNIALGLNLKKQ